MKLVVNRAKKCEQMVGRAVDEIKARVEARIAQALEKAESDTYSGFLFTLWLNHSKMDFSFFSEEAIKEVKQFAAETTKDAEASTLLDPSKVILLVANTKV